MQKPRVRASSYVTRSGPAGVELLVFAYPTRPEAGHHVPGGGVDPGERPDDGAVREAIEETGISGALVHRGLVGTDLDHYGNGNPFIALYFHLETDEPRDAWTHTVIGDPAAWDTGLPVTCRFVPLTEAGPLLRTSWLDQSRYLHHLAVEDVSRAG
ncbi:NUDIX domain-containing protein [Asanoa sp. WMMD1127]|uniref:NUDIX domain-containing protein n=1 Tax=Asanoa sp. WMMD1127 TaxID=3016107 RepID=UPI002417F569|nr:NUDIX domain-containing protein [Asanoa sp. WMMD1127]MDG4823883.1 NUDIX domain-containing protein [Asanoa sp. WMMD1127]